MGIDLDRWRRLYDAYREAIETAPAFIELQAAAARKQRAQAALEQLKAAGPGPASGPPRASARRGVEILPGLGGYQPADAQRALDADVKKAEGQLADATHAHQRLDERIRRGNARSAELYPLVNAARRHAADIGVLLPGDEADEHRSVTLAGPPPGTPTFTGGMIQ